MTANKRSYWIRSGLITTLERLFIQIFRFGGFYFLVRSLSKEMYGVWVLFFTVGAFIEVARFGLIQNALVKYLSTSDDKNYAKISTASLFINFCLTMLSVVALCGVAKFLAVIWNAPQIEYPLYIYSLTTIALIPFSHFYFVQQANLDFRGNFWANFVRFGLFFSYVACFFFLGKELEIINLAIVQVIAACAGGLVGFFFAKKYLKFSAKIDWSWVKTLLNFGRFTFGTNISTQLFKTVDKMMLGAMRAGTGSVALYDAALKVNNLLEVPSMSMAAILFPQSAKIFKKDGKKAIKRLYEKSVGAVLAIILPMIIVTIIFAKPIMNLIAGTQYIEATPLLVLTILYSLFVPFDRQFGTILDSIGKPKINFYFVLIGAFINIVTNYFFIQRFGNVGAAYGTLTAYGVRFLMYQVVLNKELGVVPLKAFVYMFGFYKEMFLMGKNKLSNLKSAKIS